MKRFMNVGQPPAPSGAYYFRHLARRTNPCAQRWAAATLPLSSWAWERRRAMKSYNFTKDLFVAEASPYYAAFAEDTYRPSDDLTIEAGLRWDIFGGRTERHNRLEYFDPKATNTASGVSYTGAEVYVNQRQPLSLYYQFEGLQSAPGLLLAAGEPLGSARRRRLLLWPERGDGRQRGLSTATVTPR